MVADRPRALAHLSELGRALERIARSIRLRKSVRDIFHRVETQPQIRTTISFGMGVARMRRHFARYLDRCPKKSDDRAVRTVRRDRRGLLRGHSAHTVRLAGTLRRSSFSMDYFRRWFRAGNIRSSRKNVCGVFASRFKFSAWDFNRLATLRVSLAEPNAVEGMGLSDDRKTDL